MTLLNRKRHDSGRHYVEYQAEITRKHLLPLFRKLNVPTDRILDVGCGKGGCAIALAQALGTSVSGFDIREDDIEIARLAATEYGVRVNFDVVNVVTDPLPDDQFGLLLMRDVVEHLPDIRKALLCLRGMLDAEGMLYVTFPPWRGPYAGHQHNARSVAKFMPYLHALVPNYFLSLLERWEPARIDWLADERQIFQNRLSRKTFEKIARDTGWKIHYRQTYFLRPAFIRMGLPVLPNGVIGRLPGIGEVLTTACEYLLKPEISTR